MRGCRCSMIMCFTKPIEHSNLKRKEVITMNTLYVGLAWKQHQSGVFEAEITRLIPSGNRFLKYYLCEAAFSLVRCDKEYSDFYHLKYKEVNIYQHKRALALTSRKFVRLVFRLLKDNRLYTSAR